MLKTPGAPRRPPGRRFCSHGLCTSNTVDKVDGVKLLPFAKPCKLFISSLYDESIKHSTKQCAQCSKCIRWIHLCKRADNRLQQLYDIDNQTFICTKHFANGLGPTEMNPDPYPATAGGESRISRRGPKERTELPPAKKRKTSTRNGELPPKELKGSAITTEMLESTPEPIASDTSKSPYFSIALDHGYGMPEEVCGRSPEVDTLAHLKALAHSMVDNNLIIGFNNEQLTVYYFRGQILEKTCVINRELMVEIYVLGQRIKDSNNIWKKYPKKWDMKSDYNAFLKDFSENWFVCQTSIESNIVQKLRDSSSKEDGYEFDALTGTIRSRNCALLTTGDVCVSCKKMIRSIRSKLRRPTFSCRKISKLTREEAQKKLRLSKIQLSYERRKVSRRTRLIKKLIGEGPRLTFDDSNDLLNILVSDGNKTKSSDLAKIFFSEQIKAAKAKSPTGHRWHPLIIKWCLYLKSKSASTYSALRKVITLPSERRLYDLQTLNHVKPGFQESVLDSIAKEVDESGSEDHRRYCSLLLDEVKIQEDLVYKSATGELIGFVELSDVDQLLSQIENEANGTRTTDQPLATHVLQLMVRGITSSVEATYAYYPTKTLKSANLYPIVWGAIEKLESKDIRVLAIVSDGAATNRSFYKMCNPNPGVQWCTTNVYAYDERPLFFVCDVPHLIKTTRNAFSNSGSHKKSRLLWKNGKNIEWYHVVKAFKEDLKSTSFRILHHITNDHLYLTPTSQMKVKLAVQVLSQRMATAVKELSGPEASETVHFIETFNKFFDIMNARHLMEATHTRNPNVAAFSSAEDERLNWLNEEFLGYLDEWKKEVNERPGNFTPLQKKKMMLSRETLEGLYISVKSITGLITFMLGVGAQYVLTNNLNQDRLELYFSKQRGAAGANTNPSILRYGDNVGKLHCLKEYAHIGKGNITR